MRSSAPRKPPAGGELDEPDRMVLGGADRDAFLEAILNPPEPSEKLVAALKRYRALLG